MKDRIQIDGVWYVKENKPAPLDIIFYDSAVYEDNDYCIEASRDKESLKYINIEVIDKKTNTKEYIDNKDYLKDVMNGDSVDFMNEELFRNFLINLNWIK
jgi:predicted adenine nucleotide alpha hydrolase (AANH) superfamily ATPase